MSERASTAPLSAACTDAQGILKTLQAQGAQRLDPVRFRFLEVLANRMGSSRGPVQARLAGQLHKASRAYDERWQAALAAKADTIAPARPGPRPGADALKALVARVQRSPAGSVDAFATADASPADMPSVRRFKSVWSRLDVERRLSQAIAQAPHNAGPLNSHKLALETLAMMRDLSPSYLQRFVAHLQTLQGVEQAWLNAPQEERPARRGKPGARAGGPSPKA